MKPNLTLGHTNKQRMYRNSFFALFFEKKQLSDEITHKVKETVYNFGKNALEDPDEDTIKNLNDGDAPSQNINSS